YEPPSASISGNIQTSNSQDIAGVTVRLLGAVSDSVLTDASGDYLFTNLPLNQDYTLSFSKTNNTKNGVNIFDLILISDHILGINPFSEPNQLLAADANSSSTITGFDLVEIRKVILDVTNTFPIAPSWIFDDNDIFIQNLQTDLIFDVTGIKMGDVNFSANPGN
ncbi:MAG: carboxypeptidase regulatory-like domain-containing protein, partial [Bacteroidota bacterium]